jgi:hypothetical protein
MNALPLDRLHTLAGHPIAGLTRAHSRRYLLSSRGKLQRANILSQSPARKHARVCFPGCCFSRPWQVSGGSLNPPPPENPRGLTDSVAASAINFPFLHLLQYMKRVK